MIINQYNKDNILKGKMKRGFNQLPEELKQKIINNKTTEEKKDNKDNNIDYYLKFKNARNNLKRF